MNMVTVFQVFAVLDLHQPIQPKYIGSFFSRESAEEKLGWWFVAECCVVQKF